MSYSSLRLRIQRVLALFIEFVLQLQAYVVGFDGSDRFDDCIDPPIHLKFSQLFCRCGTVTGVVIGEARVLPDTGVDVFGKGLAVLVGAGFGVGAVEVDRVGAGDQHLRGFAFAGVHVDRRLLWRAS